jgi:hypothetical protein
MTETDVTRELLAYLLRHGWQQVRHNPVHPVGPVTKINGRVYLPIGKVDPLEVGFSDWIMLHPRGFMFGLEMKAPGEKPRPDQEAWIKGFPTLLTWADGLPRLEAFLSANQLPPFDQKGPCWLRNECPV